MAMIENEDGSLREFTEDDEKEIWGSVGACECCSVEGDRMEVGSYSVCDNFHCKKWARAQTYQDLDDFRAEQDK